MSDHTINAPRAQRREPGAEFWLYFAAVFAIALPVACGFTLRDIVTGRPVKGPVTRARAKAWEIAPLIFSA